MFPAACRRSGKSQRGKQIPEWRRFDVEDIKEFSLTEETFPGARPVPFPHSKWDQVLESVCDTSFTKRVKF